MTGAPHEAPGLPAGTVWVIPVPGLPEVRRGDDLGHLVLNGLAACGLRLRDGDVVVVSSKIVSKASGLREELPQAGPSADPQVHQAAARAAAVRRHSHGVVAERETPRGRTAVVRSHAGPVLAAAGLDASNTGPDGGLLVLPGDPDLAARQLYSALLAAAAPAPLPRIGVLLTDTAGRPWREGQVDLALGSCGVAPLDDLRGGRDADGRELSATARAVADEIASAADLVKGKAAGVPLALVRGLPGAGVGDLSVVGARSLVRTGPGDWFALGAVEAVRAALGVPPGSAASEAVGVASVLPESEEARLTRAIRLGTHGQPPGVGVAVGPGRDPEGHRTVVVGGPDRVAVGRVAARLEVALHAESVTAAVRVAVG